jgi:hypothetical protein
MVESMQALSAIASILVILDSLHSMAFTVRRPRENGCGVFSRELTGDVPVALQNRKRAWFTDTLEDVNGVATTIRKMTAAGAAAERNWL